MSTHHTPEDLVSFYHLSHQGLNSTAIAEQLGLSSDSIASALRNLNRYLKNKTQDQAKLSRNYKAAVKLIRKQARIERRQSTEKPAAPRPEAHMAPHVAALKTAFEQFEQAIAQYIQGDIRAKYGALEEENTLLREEVERLKKAPKNLNWIDSLVVGKEEQEG